MEEENIYEILQHMKHFTAHGAGKDREHLAGKLALLKQLEAMLRKQELQQALLDKGLLRSIALWLKPLSEGHLPQYPIRKKLLKLLLHHCKCIKKRHLSESKLGKIIFQLASHPEETVANRLIATTLFTRWARDVYYIRTDYRGMSSKDRMKKEMERVSDQAMVVDATPTKQSPRCAAAMEETNDAQLSNLTLCEKSFAVNQAAVDDPVSNTDAFVSVIPSSSVNISQGYNISDDQMQKCEQILNNFFKKKNQTCPSRANFS